MLLRGNKGGGGKGGEGGEQRTPVEAPNTLRSKTTARLIDLLCEGPIKGLVDNLKSIYLDETPIMSSKGTYNFKGLVVDTRFGLPDQDHVPGASRVEDETPIGVEVKAGSPVVRTISEPDTDAVIIKLMIPNLSSIDNKTGDINPTIVQIAIDIRTSGGTWTNKVIDTINGKTNSPYERAYRIELPYGGNPWEVRMRRITPDSGTQTLQNKTYFSSLKTVIDAKLTYPDCALVCMTVDAEQFASRVPNRAYEIFGTEINVPTNYNPETRVYTGIWDGTFKIAWTDNPAWVFYDLLISDRYGLGTEVKGYYVDKWALYDIAKYCDELVSDGKGGMEPRFRFNGIINMQSDAYRVLNTVASSFQAMPYWGAGVVTITQDKPADPVKLVTPANVIDGVFNYSGTSLKARHTVAMVSWNDPTDGYKSSVEIVEDHEAIWRYGYKPTEVSAFGCTSRSQAHRYGRWLLDNARYCTETVTYKASFDHADLRPGDIIAIADPAYAGARMGGRLKSATTTVLELDAIPTESVGVQQSIWITLPTGELVNKPISGISGSTVTLSSALPQAPVSNSMFVLVSSKVAARQFRVISVGETAQNIYELTALEHDPNKYDRIEKGIKIDESDYSILPSGDLLPPTNLAVVEYLYKTGVSAKSAMDISYDQPDDPRAKFFEVQVQRPGGEGFQRIGITENLLMKLEDTIPGIYKIQVRSVSALGLRSEWLTKEFNILGLLSPPADVQNFQVTVNNKQMLLSWDPVPDLDFDFYEIKFSPADTGATWGNTQLLIQVKGTNITLPARNGTYLIKAVDTSGIYSINPAGVLVGVADILNKNIVEIVREDPTWPGVKENVFIFGENLALKGVDRIGDWNKLSDVSRLGFGLNGVVAEGVYYAQETVDMGEIYTCNITSDIRAYGIKISNQIKHWVKLNSIDKIASDDPSKWSVELQQRQSNDLITWTDWKPFVIGEYTARAFQYRLIMKTQDKFTTPIVTKMEITVDMPDRVYSGHDLVCPVTGLRVDFIPAFAAQPSVATNTQGQTGGEYCEISNCDATGFNIIFKSIQTDLPVQRTFDYVAHGYGRKVL